MTDKAKRILYVSNCYEGSRHDYTILQDCFPPCVHWFKQKRVRLDLGFQGFKDLYQCKPVYLPYKKKRAKKGQSNALSDAQKRQNKEQAAKRIKVEHSIGGMKRYKILSHRLTLKSKAMINSLIGVCAGLWNLTLNQTIP